MTQDDDAPAPPAPSESAVADDLTWHLADDALAVRLTQLEYALMRANEAFSRWQSECLASSTDLAATGAENTLLHVIRMNDRPKSAKELARLTNRQDMPNIQYGLRKLLKAGLIGREGSSRTGVTYHITDEGRAVTDRYAEVRRMFLLSLLPRLDNAETALSEAAQTLELMSGIYDAAALSAVTHRK